MTTPVPSAPVGPLSRALFEALESVAARDQVRSLLRGALLSAHLESVPEEIGAFHQFTDGALRESLERVLGASAAEMVVEQLGHVLRMVAPVVARRATGTTDDADDLSGERIVDAVPARSSNVTRRPELAALRDTMPLEAPTLFPPRSTAFESGTQRKRPLARVTRESRGGLEEVAPSSSGSRALATDVIVVSLDPHVAIDVETRLRGRSRVRGVVTVAELMLAIHEVGSGRLAIVLDTGVPSIDVPTFASLGIAPPTQVVLWGTDDRHKARLAQIFPQVTSWVASNAYESPADVLLAD